MNPRHSQYFCVHGHFYQPPRGNPVTGHIGFEPDAGDYRNWNERITAEAYRPNAEIGNFDRISYDIGEPLLSWLRRRAPETYARILQADAANRESKRVGNAVGSVFNHVILPLQSRRNKQTQLRWGYLAFQHHFGRPPEGVWLPEMAVDIETLEMAAAAGYKFTIIGGSQIEDGPDSGGPFNVRLPDGGEIAVFVRNDDLSNDLSFRVSVAGGAGHWARNKLAPRRANQRRLTLIATGGETFGHHHLGEERFLHWLLAHEAQSVGYRVVTLTEALRDYPPTEEVQIKEYTSYSDPKGVLGWFAGWKATLMRAFTNLNYALDEAYLDVMRPLGIDGWALRDEYVRVWLGDMPGDAYLAMFKSGLKSEAEANVLAMLNAQFYMAKAFTSNAFFHEDFDHPESRYSIGNAALALRAAEAIVGPVLERGFKQDLKLVVSDLTERTGLHVYDDVLTEFFTAMPETSIPTEPEAPAQA